MDFLCTVKIRESEKITRLYVNKPVRVFSHQEKLDPKDAIEKNLKFIYGNKPFKVFNIRPV